MFGYETLNDSKENEKTEETDNSEENVSIEETESVQQNIDEEEIDDFEFIKENRKRILQLIFQADLKEVILKCACVIYFIIGTTLSIGTFAQSLDINQENGKHFVVTFVCLTIMCFCINFVLIIHNHNINTIKMNKSIQTENKLLSYIVIAPLFITAIIFVVFNIVQVSLFSNCLNKASTISFLCFYVLFLISVIILFLDSTRMETTKLPSTYNKFIYKASIIMTIVGLVTSILWWFTYIEICVLKTLMQKYFNISYYSNITNVNPNSFNISALYIFNQNVFNSMNLICDFLTPYNLALLVICIIACLRFLSIFLIQNKQNEDCSPITLNRKLKISFPAVIVGVCMIIMPILSIILRSIWSKNDYINLVFHIAMCIIFCFGIFFSCIQIKEMRSWNKILTKDKDNTVIYLIWIGYFGKIIFIINSLSICEQMMLEAHNNNKELLVKPISVLNIIHLILLTIQITFQSIIVYLVSERIPRITNEGSLGRTFCPSVCLFCLNIGCLFITIYMAPMSKIKEFNSLPLDLFHKGLHVLSNSFSFIYRLHGCVFFGILLRKVHE